MTARPVIGRARCHNQSVGRVGALVDESDGQGWVRSAVADAELHEIADMLSGRRLAGGQLVDALRRRSPDPETAAAVLLRVSLPVSLTAGERLRLVATVTGLGWARISTLARVEAGWPIRDLAAGLSEVGLSDDGRRQALGR